MTKRKLHPKTAAHSVSVTRKHLTTEATANLELFHQWCANALIPEQGDHDQNRKAKTAKTMWGAVILDIRKGKPIDPRFAEHVAKCLQLCVDDPRNADRYLGLRKPQGAPSKDDIYFGLAQHVQLLMEQGIPVKAEKRGPGRQDAIDQVAAKFNVDRNMVLRSWRRFKRIAHLKYQPLFPALLPPNPFMGLSTKERVSMCAKQEP